MMEANRPPCLLQFVFLARYLLLARKRTWTTLVIKWPRQPTSVGHNNQYFSNCSGEGAIAEGTIIGLLSKDEQTMPASLLPASCGPEPCPPLYSGQRVHLRWGPAAVTGSTGPRKTSTRIYMSREPQRRRLVDVLMDIPSRCRSYLKSPLRRALWGGIAILAGFYVALRVSISYGALPVNDWLAAAVFFLFTEMVTWYNYSRPVLTFPVAVLNNFKLGFTYGLFVGALKL